MKHFFIKMLRLSAIFGLLLFEASQISAQCYYYQTQYATSYPQTTPITSSPTTYLPGTPVIYSPVYQPGRSGRPTDQPGNGVSEQPRKQPDLEPSQNKDPTDPNRGRDGSPSNLLSAILSSTLTDPLSIPARAGQVLAKGVPILGSMLSGGLGL